MTTEATVRIYETKSVVLVGLEPHIVTLRATVLPGALPGQVRIIGLDNEAAETEASLRVKASLAELKLYENRPAVAVNIAMPGQVGDLACLDLAIAVAVLGAAFPESVPAAEELRGTILFGALALTGELRHVRGALPAILGAARAPYVSRIVVPAKSSGEAAIATTWERIDVPVYLAPHLREVIAYLRGTCELNSPPDSRLDNRDPLDLRLSDCYRVPEEALNAFADAVRAKKSVLLVATPGAGKTMLARRAGLLLPLLSPKEAVEVAKIHSAAGLLESGASPNLCTRRPFRVPHCTVSEAGLLGGRYPARPGEVSLAHDGVLFLDEAIELRASVLNALMRTLEKGEAEITHSTGTAKFPAKPLLILAASPCACGGWGGCKCTPRARERYAKDLERLRALVDVTIEWGWGFV